MLFLILPALSSTLCTRSTQDFPAKPVLNLSLSGIGAATLAAGWLVPQQKHAPYQTVLDANVPLHRQESAAEASDALLISLSVAAGVHGVALGGICWWKQHSLSSLYPVLEAAEMGLLATGPNLLTKKLAGRPRPYTQGDGFGNEDDDYQSFYSGHTATSAAATTLMAGFWARSLTDRRWVWGSAQLLAGAAGGLGVGALRVEAARHYWSDVAVGTAAGTLAGFLPLLPDYLGVSWHSLTLVPTADGWAVSGIF